MRLLIISTLDGFAWGGSEELWYHTALAASKAGHEIHVSMFGERPATHRQVSALEQYGVQVRFVGNPAYRRDSITKRIARKLAGNPVAPSIINRFDWIERLAPDLVLVNASTATSLSHFPDLRDWMLQTALPFATLVHHHFESGLLPESHVVVLQQIFLKAKHNYIVAWRNLEVLERQLAMRIPRVKWVQNPVNVTYPALVPMPESATPQIAVVARLDCNCKGQDILIQALADERWNNVPLHVNLYGKGPDEAHLRALIAMYQLEDRVLLKGHVNGIAAIWEQNHLLMLPSISEGTPISLVEAMSCGRAAVVTDVGDNARMVKDGVTGFVADGYSTATLNKVLQTALASRDKWATMGTNAYKQVLHTLSPDPAGDFCALLTD